MGERYYITGVQIVLLLAFIELKDFDRMKGILDIVQDKQFMGRV